ncbi:hypothetical protein LZ318_10860 [Saccharopolyspora indica]|uniref:hypothetical protein n=1 Tax=Saccharopolyspora indica TaxID=1229659 RepID=UPI0022EB23C5|nr:hypothetical protein [Saccharopolyspora indica]MDA3645327.1 hypothetical protein [Saccharopolyspora indica]
MDSGDVALGEYFLQWWGALAHANGVVEQGVGLYGADSDHVTAGALREDLVRVLTEPSFRENAVRLRDETKGIPTPPGTSLRSWSG